MKVVEPLAPVEVARDVWERALLLRRLGIRWGALFGVLGLHGRRAYALRRALLARERDF